MNPKRIQRVHGNGGSSMVFQILGLHANAQPVKQVDIANVKEVVLESCENEISLLESPQHSASGSSIME
jgi:hypothetical protein